MTTTQSSKQERDPNPNGRAGVSNSAVYIQPRFRLVLRMQGIGASTNGPFDVFINTNATSVFFNIKPNQDGTVTVQMPNSRGVLANFTFQDVSTLEAFIILHELGHQIGAFGPDNDPANPPNVNSALNGANSASILE